MKIGDLVRLRSGFGKHGAGIIVGTYSNESNGTYSEMRVRWFSEWANNSGCAWFLIRDLETLSENR